jgi:hypothetical protein
VETMHGAFYKQKLGPIVIAEERWKSGGAGG